MNIFNIIPELLKLIKKPKFCIWVIEYKEGRAIWRNINPDGNSLKNCRRAIEEFNSKDFPLRRYVIMPKGISPYV